MAAGQPPEGLALLHQAAYLRLLVIAAILGVPITVVSFALLDVLSVVEHQTYTRLPHALGFGGEPVWWPLVPLALAGLIVGLTVRYLPGEGGESPADGFHAGGPPRPQDLSGIAVAAVASIGLGAVVGPEAPLIALGGGLAYLVVWLVRRDMPGRAGLVIAATGSFAAVSTLLGPPLAGAFLLMEATGLGGAAATAVLVPGMLGAGIGALVFVGLGSLTGKGAFSLAIPTIPAASQPTVVQLCWAVAVGLAAAPAGILIKRLALLLRGYVRRRVVPATVLAGTAVALVAIAYAELTGRSTSEVLFSGEAALPTLVEQAPRSSGRRRPARPVWRPVTRRACCGW